MHVVHFYMSLWSEVIIDKTKLIYSVQNSSLLPTEPKLQMGLFWNAITPDIGECRHSFVTVLPKTEERINVKLK